MTEETPTTFDMPGSVQYSMIRNIPAYETPEFYGNIFASFTVALEARSEAFGGHMMEEAKRVDAQAQRPQQGRQQQSRRQQGRGETRADKYLEIEWDGGCDECGGPVGRYPQTGQMSSDKAVCLTKCKDGKYIHTVGWLDDGADGAPALDDEDAEVRTRPF